MNCSAIRTWWRGQPASSGRTWCCGVRTFQIKAPLSQQKDWDTEVPWHQDCAYFQPSPNVILSAWIAVDDTTRANGCMQVLPGSHKRLYPHISDPDAEIFSRGVDPSTFDASDAVDLELKPGQFIFFNESTLHYSPPNKSETRRFGITPRLTVPFVDVGRREQIDVLMVKGEDYMGFYKWWGRRKIGDSMG